MQRRSERRSEQRCPSAGLAWFMAGYAGVAGFFGLEAARRDAGATGLDPSADDQGTTATIVIAFALAAILSPIARRLAGPRLPELAGPVGLTVEGIGLGLRGWSMRILGRSYSRTLRTEDQQPVVDTGPYRLVRHPGYLGSLLVWTGFALTSRSLAVVGLVGALLGRAYQKRMAAEEVLLARELPGYADYADRTRRLVPFVW